MRSGATVGLSPVIEPRSLARVRMVRDSENNHEVDIIFDEDAKLLETCDKRLDHQIMPLAAKSLYNNDRRNAGNF